MLVNDVQPISQCVKPHDVCLFHDVVKFMSFVSEYNLGRDESTTYFLASLACSLCELLRNGRSFHSQTGEAQADGASHRRGHRPFDDLAPYHSKTTPRESKTRN